MRRMSMTQEDWRERYESADTPWDLGVPHPLGPLHPSGPRKYRLRILPNLGHEYPSGTNYPIDYVSVSYQWTRQYTR